VLQSEDADEDIQLLHVQYPTHGCLSQNHLFFANINEIRPFILDNANVVMLEKDTALCRGISKADHP